MTSCVEIVVVAGSGFEEDSNLQTTEIVPWNFPVTSKDSVRCFSSAKWDIGTFVCAIKFSLVGELLKILILIELSRSETLLKRINRTKRN